MRDTLTTLCDGVLEYLLRHAPDEVLAALGPALFERGAEGSALHFDVSLALNRPEVGEYVAAQVPYIAESSLRRLLRQNPRVHPAILTAVLDAFGRKRGVAEALAERRDLTPAIATRLARRSTLHAALRRNAFLPANGSWRLLTLPRSAGGGARYSRARALALATKALERLAEGWESDHVHPDLYGVSRAQVAREALRLLPPGECSESLVDAVGRCIERDLAAANQVTAAAVRTGSVRLAALAAEVDPAGFLTHFSHPVIDAPHVHAVTDAEVAKAVLAMSRARNQSGNAEVRNAALLNPACVDEAVASLRSGAADHHDIAANPALPRDIAVEYIERLGEEAHLLLPCRNLESGDRVAIASGPARPTVLAVLSREVRHATWGAGVTAWLTPEVFAALGAEVLDGDAMTAPRQHMDLSIVMAESARRHPRQRGVFVDHVSSASHIGSWEASDIVEWLNRLSDDELLIASRLLPSWTESIDELCAVAASLASPAG